MGYGVGASLAEVRICLQDYLRTEVPEVIVSDEYKGCGPFRMNLIAVDHPVERSQWFRAVEPIQRQHPSSSTKLLSAQLHSCKFHQSRIKAMARKYLGGSGERLTVWISIAASTVLM
jgi:hypothetical protein